MPVNIVIVDDHQLVIDGLSALLAGNDELRIVATTTDASLVPGFIAQQPVDVLITDVLMPKMNGLELAKQVSAAHPKIRILALSMSGEGTLVNQMIEDGNIAGYALKNIGKDDLVTAIRKIAAGGIYFSDEVLQELSRFNNIKKQNPEVNLTDREIEIIRLIEQECSNKEIADRLFISERTVETHRKNILRKTKSGSIVGLVKYAYEHKLIAVRDRF
jgi:two-component system, NarL family, nitrate/nitrite response regulator NarL